MKRILLLTAISLLTVWLPPAQKGIGWRGIVPLHSNRSEVERLIGISADECRCSYKTEGGSVNVEYAEGKCRGGVPGWNVPADTVLRFTVYPKDVRRFSDLNLKLAKYKTRQDDTFTTYYFNREEGIQYSVSPEGNVNSITYAPSAHDAYLRCPGFPKKDGSFMDYLHWDQYGDLDFENETGRLDSFVIMLANRKELKGYIVVYAGRVACPGEAKARGARALNYLVETRGLDRTRIATIDGGYREDLLIELYAIPQDNEPPTIIPTITPSQVKIIKGRRCRSLTQ